MCQGYAKPSCKLALGPFVDVIAVDEHRGLGGRVTKDTLWIRGPHPIPPEFDFERQKWICFADSHTPRPSKVFHTSPAIFTNDAKGLQEYSNCILNNQTDEFSYSALLLSDATKSGIQRWGSQKTKRKYHSLIPQFLSRTSKQRDTATKRSMKHFLHAIILQNLSIHEIRLRYRSFVLA